MVTDSMRAVDNRQVVRGTAAVGRWSAPRAGWHRNTMLNSGGTQNTRTAADAGGRRRTQRLALGSSSAYNEPIVKGPPRDVITSEVVPLSTASLRCQLVRAAFSVRLRRREAPSALFCVPPCLP